MRVRLIGDHSNYHCGSYAAISVIKQEVARHGCIVSKDSDYDLLVVNGEGSMHHDSKGCRNKISEIESALRSGRRAMLINTVWQNNPPSYGDIIRNCDKIVAREVYSAQQLEGLGLNAEIALDQSYFYEIEELEPFDFDGDVVITDFYSKEFSTFARITGKWVKEYHYVDMSNWSWSKLIASLKTASLLITGRHHAVYAACKARIPFLALEGNTHKISGLIKTADIDIPVYQEFKYLKKAIVSPQLNVDKYESLFDWMESQARWKLFP